MKYAAVILFYKTFIGNNNVVLFVRLHMDLNPLFFYPINFYAAIYLQLLNVGNVQREQIFL